MSQAFNHSISKSPRCRLYRCRTIQTSFKNCAWHRNPYKRSHVTDTRCSL